MIIESLALRISDSLYYDVIMSSSQRNSKNEEILSLNEVTFGTVSSLLSAIEAVSIELVSKNGDKMLSEAVTEHEIEAVEGLQRNLSLLLMRLRVKGIVEPVELVKQKSKLISSREGNSNIDAGYSIPETPTCDSSVSDIGLCQNFGCSDDPPIESSKSNSIHSTLLNTLEEGLTVVESTKDVIPCVTSSWEFSKSHFAERSEFTHKQPERSSPISLLSKVSNIINTFLPP